MSAAAPPIDLTEFEGFVRSPLASRVALVVSLGGHFPKVADDPWEQFLVEEAVLVARAVRDRDQEAETHAWDNAREKAREMLRTGR